MTFPKSSPPNVFIGGPVRNSPGFPLKARGNDGLWQGYQPPLRSKVRGINPEGLNSKGPFSHENGPLLLWCVNFVFWQKRGGPTRRPFF